MMLERTKPQPHQPFPSTNKIATSKAWPYRLQRSFYGAGAFVKTGVSPGALTASRACHEETFTSKWGQVFCVYLIIGKKRHVFWLTKEILPLDDVRLKKCISKLGWSFLRKANRWSVKADRPNITLYKLNFQRFVPKFCLVLMLIHRVCDDCPFFVFLLYSKGGGYSWQTTDKPSKRTSWYFWKTRIWAPMRLGF